MYHESSLASMRRLFQIAAWLLLMVIVVLSVVPPTDRPITPAPHNIEHLGIFLFTGLAFGLGYETRHLAQAFGLVIFSAAIELIQLAIPGRHARFSDFVVDALSVSIGTILAWAMSACWNRSPRRPRDVTDSSRGYQA
jgi:VanZ family protein